MARLRSYGTFHSYFRRKMAAGPLAFRKVVHPVSTSPLSWYTHGHLTAQVQGTLAYRKKLKCVSKGFAKVEDQGRTVCRILISHVKLAKTKIT